ncbi:ROK family protein [Leptospira sp. GIMC2001]|uniref:ROK family protein n=1 Tax=Leptospira sp. GIMC2001 TaxID=1513297 RepID=UPI002349C1D7|nr:ROK family protein [Leptospira sp. GIMC2001]WCL48116.1 ROK family protein [Leptospira sp. GIMC2001]
MSYILGIDIGAGSIKAGLIDRNGKIHKESTARTDASMNNDHFAHAISLAIDSLLDKNSIYGIGVGSPGPIDSKKGIIHSSANLPKLNQFEVLQYITNKINVPAYLNNDANCAALGECYFGKAKGSKNLFVFTLGTGLGGGWVYEGKLFNGFDGNGMEVGHTTIIKDGAVCGCGNLGCAESYFSAKGLLGRYKDETGTTLNAVSELFVLVESGNAAARKILDLGCDVLADAARNIVNLLNVDSISFVGGLTQSWHLYGERLSKRIHSSVFPILSNRLNIYYGENQAILGAGSLVMEGEKLNG